MDIPPQIPKGSVEPPVIPVGLRDTPPRIGQSVPDKSTRADNSASWHRRKLIAVSSGIGLLLLIGLIILGNQARNSPRKSIQALAMAVERRDRETISTYVDAPALAESFRRVAQESVQLEMAKIESDGLLDGWIVLLAQEVATGMVEVTFTPESVLAMLCGEAPKEAMKRGVTGYTDRTVDAITKDGGAKMEAYGVAGKALLRMAVGAAIEGATKDATTNQQELNPDDFIIAALHESSDRYLIRMKPKNPTDPGFGYVFKRHGFSTWKFTEVRLFPPSQPRFQTAAAQ